MHKKWGIQTSSFTNHFPLLSSEKKYWRTIPIQTDRISTWTATETALSTKEKVPQFLWDKKATPKRHHTIKSRDSPLLLGFSSVPWAQLLPCLHPLGGPSLPSAFEQVRPRRNITRRLDMGRFRGKESHCQNLVTVGGCLLCQKTVETDWQPTFPVMPPSDV